MVKVRQPPRAAFRLRLLADVKESVRNAAAVDGRAISQGERPSGSDVELHALRDARG